MNTEEKSENELQAVSKSDADTSKNDMSKHAFTLQNTAPVADDFNAYEGGNAEIVQFPEALGETSQAFPDADTTDEEFRKPIAGTSVKENDIDK